VADFQEVDCFITDAKLGNEWEQVFQQKDIDVVIARKEI
jgi:DeoR/GlpR family transcriptional regulator of sugar metabolism